MRGHRVAAVVAALVLGGCAPPMAEDGAVPGAAASAATAGTSSPAVGPTSMAADPPLAALGTPARSQRKTFVPRRIRLLSDGGAAAAVRNVDTGVTGLLHLPEDPGDVGFWVGGSLVGELYGSVVLAGHIDSRRLGVGFFAKLLDAAPGDRIELAGEGARLVYVVRSNREVGKDVLVSDSDVLDRGTPGRLVLITCTGTFDPRTRHYDRNLVVLADPEGAPTPE